MVFEHMWGRPSVSLHSVFRDETILFLAHPPRLDANHSYALQELVGALARRRVAFSDGCLDGACISLAANFAIRHGDIRYALELLYRAGKLAEVCDSTSVLPEHLTAAMIIFPYRYT